METKKKTEFELVIAPKKVEKHITQKLVPTIKDTVEKIDSIKKSGALQQKKKILEKARNEVRELMASITELKTKTPEKKKEIKVLHKKLMAKKEKLKEAIKELEK